MTFRALRGAFFNDMARGKRINDETRAAIMAALMSGQGVEKVASEYGVATGTVSNLKKLALPFLQENEATLKQKRDISGSVLDVLQSQLNALQSIAIEISRPEYLQKQDASEVAVLYGVIADKAFRIASALEPEDQPTEATGELPAEHLPN